MVTVKKPHVLLLPLGHAGHFGLVKELVYALSRFENVSVTVMSDKEAMDTLSKLQSHGDFGNLDLHLVQVFGDMPSYSEDPRFPARGAVIRPMLREQFRPTMQKLVAEKHAAGAPTCFIVDMFFDWIHELAEELSIPWFPLYSTSSYYTFCSIASGTLIPLAQAKNREQKNEPLDFQGLTFCSNRDLLEHEIMESPESFIQHSENVRKSSGILINTAEELDKLSGTLDAMRAYISAISHGHKVPRVIPIGPIAKIPGFIGAEKSSELSSGVTSKCLQWLDKQAPSSVLYVCFGTLVTRSAASLRELAHGLQDSRVPFLWVIRLGENESLHTLFHSTFESDIAERGFIETGWAPQGQILQHPSTGGFLTHCGWNSSLESMCTGTPVIAWPQAADQPMNSRFLVNVAKVGVAIDPPVDEDRLLDPEAAHVDRDVVSRAVRRLMVEEEGKELRKNAEQLKKVLAVSVAEGGSSHRNVESVLEQILHPTSARSVLIEDGIVQIPIAV